MWLLIAFIAVPLIEIGLFIQVGGWLGLWPTLAIVLLTAMLGTYMVRSQGMQVLGKLQRSMAGDGNPAEQMVHGAMILFSGALLLTPGFFTDAVGFALLIPAVRMAIFAQGRKHVKMQNVHVNMQGFGGPTQGHGRDPGTIDGEFTEVDPDDLPPVRVKTHPVGPVISHNVTGWCQLRHEDCTDAAKRPDLPRSSMIASIEDFKPSC